MIVPALLTQDIAELSRMITACSEFTDFVQIDVMDGVLVPSTSVAPHDIFTLHPLIAHEAHVMAVDPLEWITPFAAIGCERFIFHQECPLDPAAVIDAIEASGMKAGIALNPDTPVESIIPVIDRVDAVLFMSVHPGFYGAAFIPAVLDKVASLRSRYPKKIFGIDGGIKLEHVPAVTKSGINYICVGSAIMKASQPQKAYTDFLKAFNE